MKNPLRKRFLRDLKTDFGKYLVLFLFMTMITALISGYFVAADSIKKTYYEGWTKYNVEDGHITFSAEPSEKILSELEEKNNLKFYELFYSEEDVDGDGPTIRVFKNRTEVNLTCVAEGAMPEAEDEIALDRTYCSTHSINVGDTIKLNGKTLKVCGKIALVDYNSLYENNTDMMFDTTSFGVAEMSEAGYEYLDSVHEYYCYAWKYNEAPADETEENRKSEAFLDTLEDVLKKAATSKAAASWLDSLMGKDTDESGSEYLTVKNYVPKYQNVAITYAMDDMEGDYPSYKVFDALLTMVIAFIFAVTISNTISSEAGVIGTLRASGYRKSELIRHYMFMPMMITVLGALLGNVIGYTVVVDFYKNVFYTNFSLANYEPMFNLGAFEFTTILPLVLMFFITLITLAVKLKLKPIRFLRHELNKPKRRAMLLNKKIPFIVRYRLRNLFQNIPAYIVLFFGILMGSILSVFGFMFGPMMDEYVEQVEGSLISNYQYVLMNPVDTEVEGAEKYCLESLQLTRPGCISDDVSVYGIWEDSAYITTDIPEGQVLISSSIADKYSINVGDTLTVDEKYTDDTYTFTVGGIYDYCAGLAVFMNRSEFVREFDFDKDEFTGYFSNKELTDIDSDDIATVITIKDMTKVASQMQVSMAEMMGMFKYVGAAMLLLVMYVLTKQIIEKNMQSIAMTKILGFRDGEIAGLYMVTTSIVVVISMFIMIPVVDAAIEMLFDYYIYTEMAGYFAVRISADSYAKTIILGVVCYIVVTIFMMLKIKKIKKSEALKNVE